MVGVLWITSLVLCWWVSFGLGDENLHAEYEQHADVCNLALPGITRMIRRSKRFLLLHHRF